MTNMNIFSGFLQYIRSATFSLIRPLSSPVFSVPTEKQTKSSFTLSLKMTSKLNITPESFPTIEPAFTIQVQITGKYMVGKMA